jgi:signal transduction histidine kinase
MRTPLQVMGNILNALLDISMLDSGLVTPKRSDFGLATVLERIAADLRPGALRLANEKGPDTEADAGAQLCHRNRAPREASGVVVR